MAYHPRALTLVALVVTLVSCGTDTSALGRSGITVTVDTAGAVEVVRSSGTAPNWTLEKLFSAGESQGGAELAADEFAWVSSVARGPDGLLYVADIELDHIVVFDSTGEVQRTLGRAGEGPGEFESAYSLAWLADTLLTLDIGNARLGRFADGNWHGYVPAIGRLVASPVTYRLYQVGPDEVYQWAYRPDHDVVEATWRGLGLAQGLEWRRETLPLSTAFADKVVCSMGRGFSWFDHPYAPASLAHPAPDGTIYAATSDAFSVLRLGADGDTIMRAERVGSTATLGDAEWDDIESRFDEWLEDKEPRQCEPRRLARPEAKPPIAAIQVDAVGRLWVEWNQKVGTLWEIFDENGIPVGSIPGLQHDRQRSVPWLGRDHVAWITRDSLDLPQVHMARIIATGPTG